MQLLKKFLCLIIVFTMLTPCLCFADKTAATPPATEEAASEAEVPSASHGPLDFTDVDYSTPMGEAIENLVEKEVITGFPDGTFKSDQTLTRAEFAKIIVCFLRADINQTAPSGFPDVDDVGGSAHWAKSYIKIARDMEIIAGFPDGTFNPDAPVTYEQAVKMIMCALGYKNLSYPQGYITVATQKQLFTNSNHKGLQTDNITRGTTCIFVNNAYSIPKNTEITPVVGGGSFGSGGGGGGGGGGSFKEEEKAPTRLLLGIVWGTPTTMLDTSATYLYEGELAIKTLNENDELVLEEYKVASKYNSSLESYLGQYVRATITEDDEGDEYISKLEILKNKSYSLSLKLDDYIGFAPDEDGNNILEYYNSSDKETKLKFNSPENIFVIFNGRSINLGDPADYNTNNLPENRFSYITDTKNGSFKFISNDGDKLIDVIIIESMQTAVVERRQTTNNVIIFKHNAGEMNVEYTDKFTPLVRRESVKIINCKNSSEMTLSDLKEDDVLDYYESPDGHILTIYVSRNEDTSVTGTVTKFTYPATEEGTVQITDVEDRHSDDYSCLEVKLAKETKSTKFYFNYNFVEAFNEDESEDKYIPLKDDNIKLFLNKDGKIANWEHIVSTENSKYAYITMVEFQKPNGSYVQDYESPEPGDTPCMMYYEVKPKTSNGAYTTTPVTVASTVRIDGVVYRDKPDEVKEILLKAAEISNQGKDNPVNRNTKYASFIRFEMENGKITKIDTILDGERNLSTEKDERYNQLVRSTYIYDESESLQGQYKFYDASPYGFYKTSVSARFRVYQNSVNTTLVFIPGDRYDSANYKTSKFSYQNFINGMKYYVEAYNLNDKNYAQFVLQYISNGKEQVSAYSTLGVITKVENEDESESGKNTITYRVASNASEQTIYVYEENPAIDKFNDLKVGDAILFSRALDNSMYDFYYALDVENLPVKRIDNETLYYCTKDINDRRIKAFNLYPNDTSQQTTNKYARYKTLYGTAINYDENGSGILTVNPALLTDYTAGIDPSFDEEFTLNSSTTKLYVYDKRNESLTAYTTYAAVKQFLSEDLLTTENVTSPYKPDQVFIYSNGNTTSSTTLQFIYVIRSSAQTNPSNYPGVETPVPDPLADNRAAARETLESLLAESYPETDYSIHASLLESLLSDAISEIAEAETEDAINAIVSETTASFASVPSDDYIEESKTLLSDYVDIEKYESLADSILPVISSYTELIDVALTKSSIDEHVNNGKQALDLLAKDEAISYSNGEIDALIQSYEEHDLQSDETLMDLVAQIKSDFETSYTTLALLEQALEEKKVEITSYVEENYPAGQTSN